MSHLNTQIDSLWQRWLKIKLIARFDGWGTYEQRSYASSPSRAYGGAGGNRYIGGPGSLMMLPTQDHFCVQACNT